MSTISITTSTGTMRLDAEATPSIDDKTEIMMSVIHEAFPVDRFADDGEQEAQRRESDPVWMKLVAASTEFPAELTNEAFLAACEDWVSASA